MNRKMKLIDKSARFMTLGLFLFFMAWAMPLRAQSPVCYASYHGSDGSDGRSWSTAKNSIMGCYDQLPPSGGFIYLMDGGEGKPINACKPTDPVGCGIWIMDRLDSNYSSPPPGWRKNKTGSVYFIGFGGTNIPPGSFRPQVQVKAGSTSDYNHPPLWINGNHTMGFKDIGFGPTCAPSRLGYDSNGKAWGPGMQDIVLENVTPGDPGGLVGCGPSLAIGSNLFDAYFYGLILYGNRSEAAEIASQEGLRRSSNVVTVKATKPVPSSWTTGTRIGIVGATDTSFNGSSFVLTGISSTMLTFAQTGPDATSGGGYASSDRSAAVLLDGGAGGVSGGSSLTYMRDLFLESGGIKLYADSQGGGINIENAYQEAGFTPLVWVANCNGYMWVEARNLQISDQILGVAGLRSDCGPRWASRIMAIDIQQGGRQGFGGVDGPATVFNSFPTVSKNTSLRSGQFGVVGDRLVGQTDAARRGFSPSAARFTNIASQIPSQWKVSQSCGTSTLTPGIAAPDGTENAAQATNSGGKCTNTLTYYTNYSHPLAPGDIVIGGAWVRSLATPPTGWAGSYPLSLSIPTAASQWSYQSTGQNGIGDGQWDWVWTLEKLGQVKSSPSTLSLYTGFTSSSGIQAYAPVLIHIPSGTVSDNEAWEIAENLQSYRDNAKPGQVSLLRGEQFRADSIQIGDGPTITSGVGIPKDSAAPGSIYLRRDGADSATFYIFENGIWKPKL